jgi:pimeloyl-ACP methyl ester carboxylesterase
MWQFYAAKGDAFMVEFEAMAGPTKLAGLDNQGSGQVVIGLHGYLDNAESLRVLAPYLSSYRYIAIDLAGHGRSSHRPVGTHYNQFDYLQDLHALIESEGWDDVVLVGHSLGGILVTMYAALFPEKVKAVVSIDACGPLTESEETTQQQMRNALISRHGKLSNQRRSVNLDDAVKARCKISDMTAHHARQILSRNMIKEADGNTYWCSDPKLRTKSILRLTEKQAQTLMESVTCPILFIGASMSFKNLPHVYEQRSHWFESAQYVQFVGGHHIHMENSDAIGPLICQFVEQM